MTVSPNAAKPRWYQYRMKSVLMLFVIVSICLAWQATRIRRLVSESSTVSKIEALGGSVVYGAIEGPNFRTNLEEEIRHSPDSAMRSMFGVDHSFVNWVDLDNTDITGADLAILESLSGLEYLSLNNTKIDDEGISQLRIHSNLQVLRVSNTSVTEAGIAKLKIALPTCKVIY